MPDIAYGDGFIRPPKPEAVFKSMCGLQNALGVNDDLLLRLFPVVNLPEATQVRMQFKGLGCGIQAWRGLGQTPEVVNYRMVRRECIYRPQRWGEKAIIDEEMLENMPMEREGNCFIYRPNSIIGEIQEFLGRRQYDRQRKLAANMLLYGRTSAVQAGTQAVMDTQSFPINKPNLLTPAWTSLTTSQWVLDLVRLKRQYETTTLASFGRTSAIIMHPETFEMMVMNSNTENWAYFGQGFCCNRKSLCDIQDLLNRMDLPQIVLYSGWIRDCQGAGDTIVPIGSNGQIAKDFLVPPGWVTWIGDAGQPRVDIPNNIDTLSCGGTIPSVGELFYTKNVNTCGGNSFSGPVSDVFWHCDKYPVSGEVLQAWNGMFAPSCPGAIISFPVK